LKITIVYQYFGTKKSGWSTRFYDFALEWIKNGHEVRIITSPYYKSDIEPKGFYFNTVIDGIKVSIINTPDSNLYSFYRRLLNSLLFSIISTFILLFDKSDTYIFSSGPMTVLLPFFVKRKFSNKKLVLEHRDLWPDGAIEMGLLTGWKANMSNVFVNWCNQKADYVVVCSEGMMEILSSRGIRRISSIPHGCDLSLRDLEVEIILPDWTENAIILLYAGSLGLMDAVDEVIDGFILANLPINCHLVILGSGAEEGTLRNKAINSIKSEYIHFFGLVGKRALAQWYKISHVSFVLFKDYPILSTNSPNKFFDSLVFGVPIIHNTKGWILEEVNKSNCGYNVLPNNSFSMKKIIETSIYDYENYIGKRDSVIDLAVLKWDRRLQAQNYLEILKN
jgi:glycosyltransferase involved in cell wall biosynthesis